MHDSRQIRPHRTDKRKDQPLVDIFDHLDGEKARLYSLILTARNIPHSLEVSSSGTVRLKVEKDYVQDALEEIHLYHEENRDFFEKVNNSPSKFHNLKGSLITILIMACVMSLTFRYEVREFLMERWAADSSKILEGETYRVITSLFLHADPAHFFINIFMAALFFTILFEETGVGTGWFLVLIGAGAGNYLNAMMYKYDHVSIGLSTAIFSSIGTYTALRAVANGARGAKDGFKVILSGLALLGFLGAGEGRIDVSAHFYGFVSGLIIGVVFGLFSMVLPLKTRSADLVLGAVSVAIIILSMINASF